jgi:hypothetical protein
LAGAAAVHASKIIAADAGGRSGVTLARAEARMRRAFLRAAWL